MSTPQAAEEAALAQNPDTPNRGASGRVRETAQGKALAWYAADSGSTSNTLPGVGQSTNPGVTPEHCLVSL